jgi:hypothetical protein
MEWVADVIERALKYGCTILASKDTRGAASSPCAIAQRSLESCRAECEWSNELEELRAEVKERCLGLLPVARATAGSSVETAQPPAQ